MSIHKELEGSAPVEDTSTVYAEVYMGSNTDGTLGLSRGDVVILNADGTWRKM